MGIDKPLFKPLFKPDVTGKEHSLKYEEVDPEFAKFLRLNYYNVKLSNLDVSILKKNLQK